MKNIFDQSNSEKNNILEMHKRATSKHYLFEQHLDGEMEEGGGTWEGIKGFFRGKGYYYTKYLTQIQNVLEKLQKKLGDDKKIKADLDEILEDVTESSMEESKKDELLDLMVQITEGINKASQLLEMQIQQIKDLKK
jgi:uncharacterized protein YaaW (UPF0174 family)